MERINLDQQFKKLHDLLKLPKEMRWMQDGFTIVPNAVLTAQLPKEQKLLYITLLLFAFKKKQCFPGCKTIGRLIGADERTIRRNLKKLEKAGWIKIEKRKGTSSVYYLLKV
jgi:hypothetical protein